VPVILPVTLPVIFPVTLPVTSPVTAPVIGPAKLVVAVTTVPCIAPLEVTEVALRTPVVSEEGLIPSSMIAAALVSVKSRLSATLTANSPCTRSLDDGTALAVLPLAKLKKGAN